jgi:hypothetical protein
VLYIDVGLRFARGIKREKKKWVGRGIGYGFVGGGLGWAWGSSLLGNYQMLFAQYNSVYPRYFQYTD